MGEYTHPYILNEVSDISGIEHIIETIFQNTIDSGITEENLKEKFYKIKDSVFDQRIKFLRYLQLIEKKYDRIILVDEFYNYLKPVLEKKKAYKRQSKFNQTIVQNYINTKIKVFLLKSLAKASFHINEGNTYIFKKQAAILLIYAYLTENYVQGKLFEPTPGNAEIIDQFFKNIGYKPISKDGKKIIKLNYQKLTNALQILYQLGLVDIIKQQNTRIYIPIFNPYLLNHIFRELESITRKRINESKTEYNPTGLPLFNLIRYIGENYLVLIKKQENKLNEHIPYPIGAALWVLYSRGHIMLYNKGDYPIISIPEFLQAKFGNKINWIEGRIQK